MKQNPGRFPRYQQNIVLNNPDKLLSEEAVSAIFLKASTGKYFDIKKTLIEKRTTLDILDSNKKSIIHYVIDNQGLDKYEKYEIVKLLFEMGAPIDSPDENNIRPLHIASAQQNTKLINFLLEKKADPNSKDNKYFTPLHYAVTPSSTKCAKIQKLLPDRTVKINVRTSDLFNVIFKHMQGNDSVNMYLKNIAKIVTKNYVFDDDDIKNDKKIMSDYVANIMKEQNTLNSEESMKKKIIDLRKSVYERYKIKYNKGIESSIIKENSPGWGPGVNPNDKERILQFDGMRDMFEQSEKKFRTSFTSYRNALDNNKNALLKSINDFESYLIKLNNLLQDIYSFVRGGIHRIRQVMAQPLPPMINLIQIAGNNLLYNVLQYFEPNFLQPLNVRIDIAFPGLPYLNVERKFLLRDAFAVIVGVNYVTYGTHLDIYNHEFKNVYTTMNNVIIYITQNIENIATFENCTNRIMNMQSLLINLCYIITLMVPHIIRINQIIDEYVNIFATTQHDDNVILELIERAINTYDNEIKNRSRQSRFKLYRRNAAGNMDLLDSDVIRTDIVIPNTCVYMIDNVYQIGIITLGAPMPGPTPTNLAFSDDRGATYRQIRDDRNYPIFKKSDLTKQLNDVRNEGLRILANHYKNIVDIQKQVNEYINKFNYYNSLRYLRFYHNIDNGTFANDSYSIIKYQNTETITNILNDPIKKLRELPNSFDTFNDEANAKIFNGNPIDNAHLPGIAARIKQYVAYILDKYLYKLSDNNKLAIYEPPPPHIPAPIGQHNGLLTTLLALADIVTTPPDNIGLGDYEKKATTTYPKNNNDYASIPIMAIALGEHLDIIKKLLIMKYVSGFKKKIRLHLKYHAMSL